jgi:hypothetical protein
MPELGTQAGSGDRQSMSDEINRTRSKSFADFLDELGPQFFNRRMRTQIVETTRVGKCRFGHGVFARKDLKRGTIVGYYSGPVLTWNNWHKYDSEGDYVASGRFVHPVSGKQMTYDIVVVGPTRYMNHGHNPEYYCHRTPAHDMIANVQMQQESMARIGRNFRPVFAFKTICDVKKDTELLYDYGVHDDEVYYELLRRLNVPDSAKQRRRFRKLINTIEKERYKQWCAHRLGTPADDWDTRNEFFLDLLIRYLNTSDSVRFPTKKMV